jgi:murein DD-endopeptidase MepM/ murein hydrolase activator NlpD
VIELVRGDIVRQTAVSGSSESLGIGKENVMSFPISILPSVSWHKNDSGTHFGAPRTGEYSGVHPACDLISPAGTPVLAVADGKVIRGPYAFAKYTCDHGRRTTTTFAIEVLHEDFIARYGEIASRLPSGVAVGYTVSEGQRIAEVGDQCGGCMLHFEMYKNTARLDNLTDYDNLRYLYVPNAMYRRRNDLLDPTSYLDAWAYDKWPMWLDPAVYGP